MLKKTLQQQLVETGSIESGIIVSSNLIKRVEVCGFVNMQKADTTSLEKLLGESFSMVNKAPYHQFIMSDYLYQIRQYLRKGTFTTRGITVPIFSSLKINREKLEINIEDLIIPSLETNTTYIKIKNRYGSGVVVTDNMASNCFPKEFSITAKDGKAMLNIPIGSIICMARDGSIKSVGEEILAVCRYLDPETGNMCYTQYSLYELFISHK